MDGDSSICEWGAVVQMSDNKTLLFICEKYYL